MPTNGVTTIGCLLVFFLSAVNLFPIAGALNNQSPPPPSSFTNSIGSFGSGSGSSSSSSSMSTKIKGSVNMAMSIDGFIATKDGGVDWLNEQPTIEGEDFGFPDFLKSVDVIVMGRNSFDKVVSFGENMWAYGDKKIVVWTTDVSKVRIPEYLQKRGTTQCSSLHPRQLMEELEQDFGCKHAYIDGGQTIVKFLQARMVHRMELTRVPLLLGDGIPLFPVPSGTNSPPYGRIDLKHVSTKSYENGFVTSTYDVLYDNATKESQSKGSTA